ncbi:MAG: alpha-amylase family glycosyl hydrolase [Candidatus Desantisbacteria bacterium]
MKIKDSCSVPLHFEFHISKASRDKYQFDETIFSMIGNVIFANFKAVRLFAEKINAQMDLQTQPEGSKVIPRTQVMPGDIGAMGLIDEILHFVCNQYRTKRNQAAWEKGYSWLVNEVGEESVRITLNEFVSQFPTVAVYQGKQSTKEYMTSTINNIPNTYIVMEEMLLLHLANTNPAFSSFIELFDDTQLSNKTAYQRIMSSMNDFFLAQPVFGPNDQPLLEMLRSPIVAAPYSLLGQLEYIRNNWMDMLPESLISLILRMEDVIKEDEKLFFAAGVNKDTPPTLLVPEFGEGSGVYEEHERFSRDLDWMPTVVLLAKNTYVWLHQLSVKYQREITRLDHIPDEELDTLSRWGFTSLWLIGIWERSPASQRIKQICGNLDAVSSAYSIHDYTISEDLGGEAAFENLKSRAWQKGIRLAGDMVPNHMGIFSRWVVEHPDYFIQTDYSPFHVYQFNGPNLSWDGRIGIFLEDGYWNKNDAAVVFKRIDWQTGETQYIYHGNDGTHMPWNDTAQLDFLKPVVREAVIQLILLVARKFSIIRFDAAMTLAKKHFQRLWYPQPGSGGDIPSRAEHGMTRPQFDEVFNEEFWREVVDRIAKEVPDTLLLAEAFWLMEGYFVRTLGMHRVYNSAFMHMLKAEENQKYRNVLKNVLEFNPQILKRFVNFMNNPDEDTAVAQFGRDDRYFGVCILLATLPGLPMFGHGQVEGFTEKYGMEYKRSYWDEQVDEWLVERHRREIFPLLKKRYLFSDVEHFVLYDFYTPSGGVNENVFAYSNCCGTERALVIYNNKYESTCGWIHTSVAMNENGHLVQKSLAQALAINENCYYSFKDNISCLEYIRHGKELAQNGLFVEIEGFKYQVFLAFKEIQDDHKGTYARLTDFLNGRGISNIEDIHHEIAVKGIQERFFEMTRPQMLRDMLSHADIFSQGMYALLEEIRECGYGYGNEADIVMELERILSAIQRLFEDAGAQQKDTILRQAEADEKGWRILLFWLIVHKLGKDEQESIELIDKWRLNEGIIKSIEMLGVDHQTASRELLLIKLLVRNHQWFDHVSLAKGAASLNLKQLLEQPLVQDYLQINQYEGIDYLHQESLEDMLYWLSVVARIQIVTEGMEQNIPAILAGLEKTVKEYLHLAEDCGYQVERMYEFVLTHKSSR